MSSKPKSFFNLEQLVPSYLLSSESTLIVILDIHQQYVFANDAFKNTSDLGSNFIDKVHYSDIDLYKQIIQKCTLNSDISYSVKLRRYCQHQYHTIAWEFSGIQSTDKTTLGFIGIGYDITEELLAKEKKNFVENILQSVMNNIHNGNILVDRNFKILSFNLVAQNHTYKICKQTISFGQDLAQYLPNNSKEQCLKTFHLALKGGVMELEIELNSSWYEITYYPIHDANYEIFGVMLNIIDIDSRKKAEQKVLEQNEKLTKISWQQNHQVRGALASLMGIIFLIKNESDCEKVHEYIHLLDKTAIKLDKIVHEIVEVINL